MPRISLAISLFGQSRGLLTECEIRATRPQFIITTITYGWPGEYLLRPRKTWRTVNVIFMTINSSRLPTITLATFFSTGEHRLRPLIRQTLFSVPTMETGYSPLSNFPHFYSTFWDKYFLGKFADFSLESPPVVNIPRIRGNYTSSFSFKNIRTIYMLWFDFLWNINRQDLSIRD